MLTTLGPLPRVTQAPALRVPPPNPGAPSPLPPHATPPCTGTSISPPASAQGPPPRSRIGTPPISLPPQTEVGTLPPGRSLEAEGPPKPAEAVSQIRTLRSQGPVANGRMRVWAAPLLPGGSGGSGGSHRGLGGQGAGRGLQLPGPPAAPLQLLGVLTSLGCAWPRGQGGHTAAGTHCSLGGQGCSDRAGRGNLRTQLSLPGLSGHSKGRPGPRPQLGPLSQARHLPREGHEGRLATLRTRAAGQRPGPGASSWTKGPCVAEWVFILEPEST